MRTLLVGRIADADTGSERCLQSLDVLQLRHLEQVERLFYLRVLLKELLHLCRILTAGLCNVLGSHNLDHFTPRVDQ